MDHLKENSTSIDDLNGQRILEGGEAIAGLIDEAAWGRVLGRLKNRTSMSDVEFGVSFSGIRLGPDDDPSGDEVTILMRTKSAADWVRTRHGIILKDLIQAENPKIKLVSIKSVGCPTKAHEIVEQRWKDESWGEPDMGVISQGRREPPVFPTDILGDWWAKWIEGAAEGSDCAPDYVLMPLLASASICIGNARWIWNDPDWQEPPALWLASIGEPSSNKSAPYKAFSNTLQVVQNEMGPAHQERLRAFETNLYIHKLVRGDWEKQVVEARATGDKPPPIPDEAIEPLRPIEPTIVVEDITPAALIEMASGNPKGLLVFHDELAMWIESFGRFSSKADYERKLWIKAYGGVFHREKRKTTAGSNVKHLTVGAFGTIQPDVLAKLFKGPDDGMTARFLWSWPHKTTARWKTIFTDKAGLLSNLRRLSNLQMQQNDEGDYVPIYLHMDDRGRRALFEFQKRIEDMEHFVSGLLKSALGKGRGQAMRLALVIEHLWWCARAATQDDPPPALISAEAIDAAIRLMETYFIPMARRVYGDAEIWHGDKSAVPLAKWILDKKPETINLSDLRRNVRLPGLSCASAIQMAASVLSEAGWLRPSPAKVDGTNWGRQRKDYMVNPSLFKL